MMIFIGILLALILIVVLFIWNLRRSHFAQDKLVLVRTDKRSKARLTQKSDDRICFEITVPYENNSNDEAIFLDAFTRIYLPDEQYDGACVRARVNNEAAPREDDYFEALIFHAGDKGNLILKFEVTPRNGKKTAEEALRGIPDFDFALYVERRSRGPLFHSKDNIRLTKEELAELLK